MDTRHRDMCCVDGGGHRTGRHTVASQCLLPTTRLNTSAAICMIESSSPVGQGRGQTGSAVIWILSGGGTRGATAIDGPCHVGHFRPSTSPTQVTELSEASTHVTDVGSARVHHRSQPNLANIGRARTQCSPVVIIRNQASPLTGSQAAR